LREIFKEYFGNISKCFGESIRDLWEMFQEIFVEGAGND
jgi:cobyric acid synthase